MQSAYPCNCRACCGYVTACALWVYFRGGFHLEKKVRHYWEMNCTLQFSSDYIKCAINTNILEFSAIILNLLQEWKTDKHKPWRHPNE